MFAFALPLAVGCAAPPADPHDPEQGLGPGHIVIWIGHTDAPHKETLIQVNGEPETAWSEVPADSAARAIYLFVKCADHTPIDGGDFTEVRRVSGRDGDAEKLLLERVREKDEGHRLIRVQLFKSANLWVPEVILVCQGGPPTARKDF